MVESLAALIGFVLLLVFIVMAVNIGKIRKNIEDMYLFERQRMIKDGMMNDAGIVFRQKGPGGEPEHLGVEAKKS